VTDGQAESRSYAQRKRRRWARLFPIAQGWAKRDSGLSAGSQVVAACLDSIGRVPTPGRKGRSGSNQRGLSRWSLRGSARSSRSSGMGDWALMGRAYIDTRPADVQKESGTHEAIEWVSDRNHLWSPEIHSRERRRKYAINRVRQHVCGLRPCHPCFALKSHHPDIARAHFRSSSDNAQR